MPCKVGDDRNRHHLQPDRSHQRGREPDSRATVPLPRRDQERQRPLVLRRRSHSSRPRRHRPRRPLLVDKINTDSGQFTATLDPHGGTTKWRFEIGHGGLLARRLRSHPGRRRHARIEAHAQEQSRSPRLKLEPNTLYHVRLVAENGAGEVEPSLEFRTYPSPPTGDKCGNRAVRQQTGRRAAASTAGPTSSSRAANAGGYDVESDLVPLQTPFTADAERAATACSTACTTARSRTSPATRRTSASTPTSPNAPRTAGSPATSAFLQKGWPTPKPSARRCWAPTKRSNSFAFGGEGICDPCFAGQGTNIPVRLRRGPGHSGHGRRLLRARRNPKALVLKYMSADGSPPALRLRARLRRRRRRGRAQPLLAQPRRWAPPNSSPPTKPGTAQRSRRSPASTSRATAAGSSSAKKSATTARATRSTTSTCIAPASGIHRADLDRSRADGGVALRRA